MSSDLKNVVIIGLGMAGVNIAKALDKTLPATHRLVVVEAAEFAYYPIASLRASVVPGWEDKPTAPASAVFPVSSRHIVISGTKVTELHPKSLKISKRSTEFGDEITFDVAIVATGSHYAFPARPIPGKTREETTALFKALQADIAASETVLIVGAGPVGVELAGEISSQHPGKKITLAHSESALFTHDFKAALGQKLLQQLTDRKVDVQFGAKVNLKGLSTGKIEKTVFDLGNGTSVEADFLFVAFGQTPNSDIVKELSPSAVNDAGFVKVKPTLQIVSEDGSLDSLFAIADITDVPEIKLAAFAQFQAPIVAANVLAYIAGKPLPKVYKAGAPLSLVTLGPTGGAGQVFGWGVGSWLTPLMKSKTLMISGWEANFKN